ncbi:MAG: helix-turn-helix domain-containing protein [Pseudonocardiaceae bacterium]
MALPPGFYATPPLDIALADSDFGPVFLAIRAEQHWTQRALGEFLDLEQKVISEVERGNRTLCDVRVVVRIANKLTIPAVKFGFGGITVRDGVNTRRKGVRWMDRRDFVGRVAGLALGMASAAGLDTERLLALLPETEPAGDRHLGAADVEIIEQVTAAFRAQDFSHGSGPIRDAAVAQLRTVLPLLDAEVAPEMHPRLQLAAAELAALAGWMSFDVLDHEAARRLWMIGLDLARETEHPLGTDLSVYLVGDMALQALHLGRPDEATHLVRIGRSAAVGRHPVSASTANLFDSIAARAHAARGDAAGCDRALGQAVEHFTSLDAASAPPWTAYIAHTGVTGHRGTANYILALAGHDLRAADRAVPLLRQALDRYGPSYARLGALYLPNLAGAHALAGDTDTAVTLGHEAVNAVARVSSPRLHDGLRVLHTALEPMRTSPGVVELRDRLATTAA